MNKQTILLFKKTSTGADQMWQAEIDGPKVTYTWGQVDGKKLTKVDVYDKGMNIGKANERSPSAQCELEVLAVAKKKVAKGYAPTMEEQGTKIPLPMLAKVYKDYKHKLTKFVHISPKLDGQRGILDLQTGKLWSRTGKEIVGVPHIAEQALKLKLPKSVRFLDGELYLHGISFEEMSSLVRPTVNIKAKANIMQYHVFDVILDAPYRDRLEVVRSINTESIIPIKSFLCENKEADKYHADFVEAGYEGTMVRMDTESGYFVGKRTHELLKKKDFLDEEFKVIGFKHEENNNTMLGACFMMTSDKVIFKATPAVPHKQKSYIWNNQPEFKDKTATVKFQNWSSPSDPESRALSKEVKDFIKDNPEFKDCKPGIVPRFPVLLRFRDLKSGE